MLAMIRKEIAVLVRDRTVLITLFLSPLLFITVMSLALGQSFHDLGSAPKVTVAVVDEDHGAGAGRLVRELRGEQGVKVDAGSGDRPLSRAAADSMVRRGAASLAVVIPPGFTASTEQGRTSQLSFVVDPTAPRQTVDPLQGAIRATADAVAANTYNIAHLQGELKRTTDENRRARLEQAIAKASSGGRVHATTGTPQGSAKPAYPSVYQQNVPGYAVMYAFFIVTLLTASIMAEKREGTFLRLLSTPMPRRAVLAGKIAPYLLVSLIQVATMFAFGRLVFGMDLGAHPLALVPVTVGLAVCAVGFGVLLSAWATSESQASTLGTITVIVLAALGGCMVPGVFMPDFMRRIAEYVPQGIALNAYQDVLVRGSGAAGVLPASLCLLGLGVAAFAVALPKFRFAR
ncbi:ABC transporter permease [Streptomyces sp. NPDC059009]|uniref:ABC transporter permease n=1 Tax=Streptomyces sp. NPDC059009 TaxID=3346694 RepID=UPI003681E858